MKHRRFSIVVPLLSTAIGCDVLGIGADRRTLIVQHHSAECVGAFGPERCLLVREPAQPDFSFHYSPIEGFTYEWGFIYELEVERQQVENPPPDASSIRTILHEVASRTRVPPGTEFDLVVTGGRFLMTEVPFGSPTPTLPASLSR